MEILWRVVVFFNVFKKAVKYTILGAVALVVLFLLFMYTLVFISGVEYYMKPKQDNKPVILNKNEQGEYRMVVRLGEDAKTLVQRNPNFFRINKYGGYDGLGFLRPRFGYGEQFPSDDISKIRLELLDEDYELALYLNGFQTDIMLANENEPLNVGFLSANLKATYRKWHAEKSTPVYNKIYEIEQSEDLSDEEKDKLINAIEQPFIEQDKKYELESRKNAYQQYQDILAVLKKYGWKPYVHLESPRVFGEDSWKVEQLESLDDQGYANLWEDGFYIDSYEKWQKYVEDDDIFVLFYRKNLLLRLSVDHEYPRLEIETNTSNYLDREDDKWMEKLAVDLPKWQAKRKEAEDALRAKGYTIDESYVDAPLPKEFLEWQKSQTKP